MNTAADEAALVGALRFLLDERRERHGLVDRESDLRGLGREAPASTRRGNASASRGGCARAASPSGKCVRVGEEVPLGPPGGRSSAARNAGSSSRQRKLSSDPKPAPARRRTAWRTVRPSGNGDSVQRIGARRDARRSRPSGESGRRDQELAGIARAGPGRSSRAHSGQQLGWREHALLVRARERSSAKRSSLRHGQDDGTPSPAAPAGGARGTEDATPPTPRRARAEPEPTTARRIRRVHARVAREVRAQDPGGRDLVDEPAIAARRFDAGLTQQRLLPRRS